MANNKAGRLIDLTGKSFGYLTVICREGNQPSGGVTWKCGCVCGKILIVLGGHLKSGHTKSCGCFRVETTIKRLIKHGHTINGKRSTEQETWQGIIKRCYRPNSASFLYYGGRGITVCDRWRFGENGKSGFECFLADMGLKPSPKLSIDRIDVNGNYEPSNCRWATAKEQADNKRLKKTKTSKYKNIYFARTLNKWKATIDMNGYKKTRQFDTEESAFIYISRYNSIIGVQP